MNDYVDDKGNKFEAGLNVTSEIVGTVDKLPDTTKGVFENMMVLKEAVWKGATTFTKEQFKELQKAVFKGVVHLLETNPGHFHIVDGHGVIGQAMSDKVNLLPVWFEKRNGTVEKFNLNLTTYQLEKIDGNASS